MRLFKVAGRIFILPLLLHTRQELHQSVNVAFHMTLKDITQTTMRVKPLLYKLMDHSHLLTSWATTNSQASSKAAQGGLCSLLPWMMLLTTV